MKVKIPKVYAPLFKPKRYKVISGGRGSGKSWAVAIYLLTITSINKLRVLCTREIQNTIADSVHKVLVDLIDLYNFQNFEITNNSIINIRTGSEFIFKGLRHNIREIKSLEGVDVVWVEEAEGVSDLSLEILIPTIRKEDSELIFTFNRFLDNDPVFVKFCKNKSEDTWYIHTTYRDNKFFPEVLEKERIKCLEQLPDFYDYIWEGQPSKIGKSNVFKSYKHCMLLDVKMKPDNNRQRFIAGIDLGKHIDYTVIAIGDPIAKEIVYIDRFNGIDWNDQMERIINTIKLWNNATAYIDATGVGDSVFDQLKQFIACEPIVFTPNTKSSIIQKLVIDIQNKSVKMPIYKELEEEFESYEYTISPRGSISYGARSGMHDDIVTAIALCNYQFGSSNSNTLKMYERLLLKDKRKEEQW